MANALEKLVSNMTGGSQEDIQWAQKLVNEMSQADGDLIELYTKIEKICDGTWALPEEVQDLDWVGPVVSTDPDTALETGVRTIANDDPKWFVSPMAPGEDNEQIARSIENFIKWQWQWADFRTDKDLTKDIARSALTYGRVCIHVTHMPTEIEASGQDEEKYQDVNGYGEFDYMVASPKNVRFKRGRYGLEAVAHVYKAPVSQVIEDYRPFASALQKDYEEGGYQDYDCTVSDLTTRDKRVVWVNKSELVDDKGDIKTSELTEAVAPSQFVLINDKREMPFIPWVIRSGGTNLRRSNKKKVKPMLAKIVETNLWDIQNTILSLTYSEAIATVASPRFAVVGPNNEIVHVDYRDPTRLMDVPEGHEVVQLQPRGIDEGLLHLSDRIKAMMDRETVARFLQNLDIPDEAAYASINAVMQSAIAALDNYKNMAEYAHADIAIIMLRYLHWKQGTAVAFGVGEESKQDMLSYNMFDPSRLYVECTLNAKAPTDYMQRINAGVAMNQQLDYPKSEVYKWLGEPDPEGLMEKTAQEKIDNFVLQLRLQEMQADSQLRMQAKAAQMQQGMQQMAQQKQAMAMAQQRQQMAQQGGGAMSRPRPEQRAAFSMARNSGSRFNPREGGTPAAMTNPGATREQITGRDRQGNQVQ